LLRGGTQQQHRHGGRSFIFHLEVNGFGEGIRNIVGEIDGAGSMKKVANGIGIEARRPRR